MAVQHRVPEGERTGRLKPIIGGGIAAIALFVLNVTLGVLTILVLGGVAGGLALFREHGAKGLSRFFIGMLLGMVLFLVLAWYGTATTTPASQ
ncbi:MAG: hypothetical protein ACTHJJ_02610 [Intrasporangium sp.]|uniref:hypothetical protein n=1 Tax=Intrasporangium sp. TaxID=1925024 RepID=UPI003F7EC1FF